MTGQNSATVLQMVQIKALLTAWKLFMIISISMWAETLATWVNLNSPVSILLLSDLPLSSFSSSAFDPIFYLHHTNIDRLLSLWVARNPDAWVTPGKSAKGSIDLPENIDIDKNTGTDHPANFRLRNRHWLVTISISTFQEWWNHFLDFVWPSRYEQTWLYLSRFQRSWHGKPRCR